MYFSPEQSINVSATKRLSTPVSGKGGGSAAHDTLQREAPLLQDAAHCIQQMEDIPALRNHLISESKHLWILFTFLFFEGWTSSYVCREAAGYSFASLFMPSIFLWLVVNRALLLSISGFFHGIWKLVNKNNCNKKRTAFLSCSTFKLSLDRKRSDVTTIKPQFSGIMYNPNNKSSIVFLVFHIRYAGSSVTAFPFSLTRVGLSAQAACSSDSYSFLKLTHFICCLNKKLHVSHDIFLHCFIHKVWQKNTCYETSF